MREFRTRELVRSWMFDQALPFWARHALDTDNGGYVEQLTLAGHDARATFKRTRVAARQVYVFSHAAVMGWSAGVELARPGMDYMATQAWQGPDKGFARTLARTGELLDETPDLYDHAFALFGFAWRHRATKDSFAHDWMHRTLDYIDAHMRHPGGLGFWHELPPTGWRQQNPHMHLTEACLAAHEATGEVRFAEAARRLVELFRTKLFDLETGTLAEYFTDDWSRAPGDDGRIVEPGHLMEWCWILNQARKQLGMDVGAEIRAANRFAEMHGINPATGMVYNSLRDDGVVLDAGSRSWPNCERIKAAIALWELDGVDPGAVIDAAAGVLLSRFLAREPAGTWMDAFDGEGREMAHTVPASTLYHVFLAFAEVLRITD